MLRADLVMNIMKLVKSADISGDLITNGYFITEDRAKQLVELSWDSIHVTLHGSDDSTDALIRNRKTSLEPTLSGLRKVVKYKQQMDKDKPEILVCMVITKYNYLDIMNMVKLADNLGLQGVQIRLVNEKYGHPIT